MAEPSNTTLSNGRFKGAKLRGPENYSIWSFQMKAHLCGRQLWRALSDCKEASADDATKQKAFSELVENLTDEMVYTIIDKESPKQVWDSLKATCRASASANRHYLAKEFRSKEFNGRIGIRNHLNAMKDLRLQLIGAGQQITEDDLVVTTLDSIKHRDYEPLINAMTIGRQEELSFDEVQAELILHETKLARKDVSQKKQTHEVAFSSTETRKCYNCNKVGHLSARCRAPRKNKGNKRQPAQHEATARTAEVSQQEFAWTSVATQPADEAQAPAKHVWADSGCSRHMAGTEVPATDITKVAPVNVRATTAYESPNIPGRSSSRQTTARPQRFRTLSLWTGSPGDCFP